MSVNYCKEVLYAGAGALTWITWDAIVHFRIEVECIWRCHVPGSWVKYTYLFVRYLPIVHGGALMTLSSGVQFSTAVCQGWVYLQLIFMELLTFVVEAILVVRLYVLYNENKGVLYSMIVAFIVEVAVMVVTLALVLPRLTVTDECLVTAAPSMFMAYWLASLAFEAFLFTLTVLKFAHSVSSTDRGQSVLFLFMRDGTWAFAMIFVAMVLNMCLYRVVTTPLVGIGAFWAQAVMSFAGSHVLLNIRRLGVPHDSTAASILQRDRGSMVSLRIRTDSAAKSPVPRGAEEGYEMTSLHVGIAGRDFC